MFKGWGTFILIICSLAFSDPRGVGAVDDLKLNIEANPGFALSYMENPAAVAFTDPSIYFSRIERTDWQWQTNRLNICLPGKNWSAAVDVRYDALDNLPNTIQNNDGRFETSSTFSQEKTAALVSLAGTLISGLWVGTNLKAYSLKIADQTVQGTGVDVGVLWKPLTNLFLGWSRADVGDTQQMASTGKVDVQLASDLFSVTWRDLDASVSYLASVDQPHLVRGQFHLLDGVWLAATTPINNPQNVSLQLDLKLDPLTIRYTTSFSELNSRQSQLTLGWSLGD